MATQRSKIIKDLDLSQLVRTGGRALPPTLERQRSAAVKSDLKQRFQTGRELERRSAQLWAQVQGGQIDVAGNAKALDELLKLHRTYAATKIVAPGVVGGLGGFLPGHITAKVTPPFDYAITIPTVIAGQTAVSGASSTNGQLSGNAVSASARGLNAGSWYSEMGIYFHPMTAGTLRLSASPSFSFQFWTNSLNTSRVRSFGSAQLGIFTLDRLGHVGGVAVMQMKHWDEQLTGQIRFDFGSNPGTPLAIQTSVTPTLIYALFVSLDVHVEGVGWPGSLAGAKLSVAVPSFTWDFEMQPVLTQG
jgi:hypothetical protein